MVAATGMNEQSSRSHSIFILKLEGAAGRARKLCLVDLAGSECMKKSALAGRRGAASAEAVEESKAINQSLSTLGLVISKLAARGKSARRDHVPYRSSKLTRVLQDALGGNSMTALVINCSISTLQVAETLSTLRFGTRAGSCVNVLAAPGGGEESMLLRTLRTARQEIFRLQAQAGGPAPAFGAAALDHEDLMNASELSAFSVHEESRESSPGTMAALGMGPRRSLPSPPPWMDLSQVREARESDSDEAEQDFASKLARSAERLSRSQAACRRYQMVPLRPLRSGAPSPLDLTPRSARSKRLSKASTAGQMSPLSLSPRSCASRPVSRRVSKGFGQPEEADEPPPIRTPCFTPSPRTRQPLGTPWGHAAGNEVSPRYEVETRDTFDLCSWEYPLTHGEALARAALLRDKDVEVLEAALASTKRTNAQLLERCAALQAETELLAAERMQPETAASTGDEVEELTHSARSAKAEELTHLAGASAASAKVEELTHLASSLYVGLLTRRVVERLHVARCRAAEERPAAEPQAREGRADEERRTAGQAAEVRLAPEGRPKADGGLASAAAGWLRRVLQHALLCILIQAALHAAGEAPPFLGPKFGRVEIGTALAEADSRPGLSLQPFAQLHGNVTLTGADAGFGDAVHGAKAAEDGPPAHSAAEAAPAAASAVPVPPANATAEAPESPPPPKDGGRDWFVAARRAVVGFVITAAPVCRLMY